MNLLVISRDQDFIARVRWLYLDGVTTVMVIPGAEHILTKSSVPKVPHVVLLDIDGLEPDLWPKHVAHLRQELDLKVIVIDHRANCRRTIIAFKHYAVNYLSKAKRTTDAKIRKAILEAFRSGLPLLPAEHLKKKRKGKREKK